jgi:hypothetical protein
VEAAVEPHRDRKADVITTAGIDDGGRVEAGIGPQGELAGGARRPDPGDGLGDEALGAAAAVGRAAPEPVVQDVAGAGSGGAGGTDREQGVIPPGLGIRELRASQMVESMSKVKGASPGPAPAFQARASSSPLTASS